MTKRETKKILFVLGMNTGGRAGSPRKLDDFERKYMKALTELITRARGTDLTVRLPTQEDVDFLYWTDLVPPAPESGVYPPTKGPIDFLVEEFEAAWLASCRAAVKVLDARANYEMTTAPGNPVAQELRPYIAQAALYMQNYPALSRPYRRAGDGLQSQVLARLDDKLSARPKIVIGHSLGSVIAWEGLCQFPHDVDLLLTVGSPMGTRKLIYDRLPGTEPRAWPNVSRWVNVYSTQDVFFTPEPELADKFLGRVEDLKVTHGQWNQPDHTHRLDAYFKNDAFDHVLLDAWKRALSLERGERRQ